MNINIGESIGFSWLIHVKKCIICQNNWKFYGDLSNVEKELNTTINKCKEEFNISFNKNEDKNYSQILKQTEVDVIGFDESGRYYLLDLAYHSGSLNYGSKETTQSRVIKKLTKMALVAKYILKRKKVNIIFATPIAGEEITKNINDCIFGLKSIFKECSFEFIANGEFEKEILKPLIEKVNTSISETEPFMRTLLILSNKYDITLKEKGKTNNKQKKFKQIRS